MLGVKGDHMIQTINIWNNMRAILLKVISYLGCWAFHPSDSMKDNVCRETGGPSYTIEEAEKIDNLMDVFNFCELHGIGIYEQSMEISKELRGDIFAEKQVA